MSSVLDEAKDLGIDIQSLVSARKAEIQQEQKRLSIRKENENALRHLSHLFPFVAVKPYFAKTYIWFYSQLVFLDGTILEARCDTGYTFNDIKFARSYRGLRSDVFSVFKEAAIIGKQTGIDIKTIVPFSKIVYQKNERRFNSEKTVQNQKCLYESDPVKLRRNIEYLLARPKEEVNGYVIYKDWFKINYGGSVTPRLIREAEILLSERRSERAKQTHESSLDQDDTIDDFKMQSLVNVYQTNGFVYLMKHLNGLTKIGFSKNPKAREKTLQAEDPRLEIIFKLKGKMHHEKQLHSIFNECRVRGEWFDLNHRQITWIKSLRDLVK